MGRIKFYVYMFAARIIRGELYILSASALSFSGEPAMVI